MRAELEQTYRQHRQTLFSLALTITGCSGLAEDAVHEAFVRLCQRTDRPAGSFPAYVYSSVRNAAVDCRRRQQRQKSVLESVFAESGSGLVAEAANGLSDPAEQRAQLASAIETLDESARQIIVMKIFGDLTFDEIAEVLETPSATVATRYRRSILKLEEILRRNP